MECSSLVVADARAKSERYAATYALAILLTVTLDAMARILDNGGYPVDIEFEEAADGEPSLPPRAAEVLAGVREALITFAEAAPNAQPHGEAAPYAQPHGRAKTEWADIRR